MKFAANLTYEDIVSLENIFQAWDEFRKGKKKRNDVLIFDRYLEDNLFNLHLDLKNKTYKHGDYQAFYVHDPKKRHIHKAPVQDRILHHLLYKYLYALFDNSFIYDSYSCREKKGTHKAVERLEVITRKVSKNYTRPCWTLKCDIQKFFASVDHQILLSLLSQKIKDPDIIWLLKQVINSFDSGSERGKGIPLGNLTSQIFANIYMDELDQFIKHQLGVKFYLRYADDFVIISARKEELEKLIKAIAIFLKSRLRFELHPDKIVLRKLKWGIDFLGYITLPHYRLPRTKTKKRVFQKLKSKIGDPNFNQSLQSYLGYLSHANSYKLSQKLKNQIWYWSAD